MALFTHSFAYPSSALSSPASDASLDLPSRPGNADDVGLIAYSFLGWTPCADSGLLVGLLLPPPLLEAEIGLPPTFGVVGEPLLALRSVVGPLRSSPPVFGAFDGVLGELLSLTPQTAF